MDFAWGYQEDAVVDAESLWGRTDVDKDNYACPFCWIPLNPVSFRKDNLVRPHFKIRDEDHRADCGLDRPAGAGVRGQASHGARSRSGPPEPYISRLADEIRHARQDHSDALAPAPRSRSGRTGARVRTTGTHPQTTQSLRPIVRWYLRNPDGAGHRLKVPGRPESTYGSVFCLIKHRPGYRYQGRHVFYGSPYFARAPRSGPGYLEYTFVQGEDRSVPTPRKFVLRVHTAGWSEGQVANLQFEMEVAAEETRRARGHAGGTRAGASKNPEPWVFFLGDPDPTDPFLFHVHEHRFICTLAWRLRPLPGDASALVPLAGPGERHQVDLSPQLNAVDLSTSAPVLTAAEVEEISAEPLHAPPAATRDVAPAHPADPVRAPGAAPDDVRREAGALGTLRRWVRALLPGGGGRN